MPQESCPLTVVDSDCWNIQNLLPVEKDASLNMFPVDVSRNPGDKALSIPHPFNSGEYQLETPDLTDFNFLDSLLDKNEQADLNWESTVMDMDIKELLSDVMSEEAMDISSLLNFNTDVSEIPSTEESYNLNSTETFSMQEVLFHNAQSCENCYDISSVSSNEYNTQEVTIYEANVPSISSNEYNAQEVTIYEPNIASISSKEYDVEESTLSDPVEPEQLIDEGNESIAGKKYLEMRRKNNIASQKSRKMRKQKNISMTTQLKTLEKENEELKSLAKKLEMERDALQKQLMSIITRK